MKKTGMKVNKLFTIALIPTVLMTMLPTTANAHGTWIKTRFDEQQIVVGEGFEDNAYNPDIVSNVKGYDANYNKSKVKLKKWYHHDTVVPAKNTAIVTYQIDYGYWSNTPKGKWINKPMQEVKGSTIGTHALKYSINYLGSVKKVKPVASLQYQLIPSVDPTKLAVGEIFKVRLMDGDKPIANANIIPDVLNHHTVIIKTDANGEATVNASNGALNVIGAEMVVPYEGNDGKATRSKIFTSLSFTLYPEE